MRGVMTGEREGSFVVSTLECFVGFGSGTVVNGDWEAFFGDV